MGVIFHSYTSLPGWVNLKTPGYFDENHPFFNGKIHYFYGHFPWLFVCSPEGIPILIPHNVSLDLHQDAALVT